MEHDHPSIDQPADHWSCRVAGLPVEAWRWWRRRADDLAAAAVMRGESPAPAERWAAGEAFGFDFSPDPQEKVTTTTEELAP
jgi:hypothetical protein